MKTKYLFSICIFLILMSIAGISASENVNQTDSLGVSLEDNFETAENDQEIIHSTDNEVELKENENTTRNSNILGMSNENEIIGANDIYVSGNTFQDISDAIGRAGDGDIIHLSGTYKNNWKKHIVIDKEISIIGRDNATLDAQEYSRIFYVTSGKISIQNITLINGAYGDVGHGGAIYFANAISDSNINATFINNTAFTGGANYFYNSVSNSNVSGTYTNNKAEIDGGGANYFRGDVSGSNVAGTYSNNKVNGQASEYGGGANYFRGDVSGSNVTGTYTNNNAKRGGANYFHNEVSTSNVEGTYINNIASNAVIYFMDYYDLGLGANIKNAIFLNNKCGYEIYASTSGIVVKDCWFGNNVSNFNEAPETTINVQVNNWLFLNATADYNSLLVMDPTNITFKLNSTDGTHVFDFDNSKLPVVNLTLTATNGDVDKTTILGCAVKYMATERGKGSVTASIEDAEYTIFLDNRLNPEFSAKVNPQEIDYGKNTTIFLSYNDTATGTVNITLTGKKHTQKIENVDLNKTIQLPNTILPDEYEVTVTYSGDGLFANASATFTLTVNQLKSDIKVVGYDIYVNDTKGLIFTATLPENATGNLTISNGITLNVTKEGKKENNSLIIEIMNDAYPVGQYNWTFTYNGDDIYESSKETSVANILSIPTAITANATSKLFVDNTTQISYNLTPDDAVGDIIFASNDTSVIEVDQNGNIKAVGEGTALITVNFGGSENYTASSTNVTITVSKIPTEINITNETVELKAYQSIGDLATLNPKEAGNLTYTSSNEDIVLVSDDGFIYARIKGTAIVTVSFAGDNKYKAAENKNITVTVTLNDASVSVENDTLNLLVDDTYIINATSNPRFLTVYYTSNNESVATVTEYGNVKAIGEGTAVITLTVGNGETYAINSTNVTVIVSKIPTEITVNPDSLDLFVGDETVIIANLTPADAGNVTFTSSDDSVVTVDNQDNVIAEGKGQAIITVSFAGDNKYAAAQNKTITVNVSLNDARVTVDNDTLDLKVDETYKINATKHPDTILLDITYKSGDNSVATVDKNGIVTAVGEGTAIITLEVGDGEIYAKNSTTVTVTVSLNDAGVVAEDMELAVGENGTIKYSTVPDGLNVTFVSDESGVYAVDENGVVTGLRNGTGSIIIIVGDDEVYAKNTTVITVKVVKAPTEIIIQNDTLDMKVGDVVDPVVTLWPSDAGNLSFKVSDDSVVLVNGSGVVTAVGEGNATILVSFPGNDKYLPSNATIAVTVKEIVIIEAPDVEKYYGGSERFIVTVTDSKDIPLVNKTVKIKINGKEYEKVTDENGTASMAIGLPSNTYNVTVTVDNQNVKSVVVVLSTVNGTDVVKMYRNATQYYATFRDSEGKYLADGTVVNFNINGVFYERKVSGDKGQAKLNINLPEGEYVITAMNPVTGENEANNITVLATIVENKDITKFYKNGTQYTVKVLGADGKAVGAGENVTFNVNGVFYTRQTNASGIVTLNINLPPKDYVITAEYKGYKVANNIKVLPVLTAEDIKMKYNDGTQFIANLVDGEGKPYADQKVLFNVNGKLYNKGTDSAGQAKLDIHLPAGQYIITSSYNGANIANKITISG